MVVKEQNFTEQKLINRKMIIEANDVAVTDPKLTHIY